MLKIHLTWSGKWATIQPVNAGNGFVSILLFALATSLSAAEEQPQSTASALQDNSFFIEEAYNQEAGVVQHIFNSVISVTRHARADQTRTDLLFTQEWPIGSQTHQFSYTIPYSFVNSNSDSANALDEVFLNYRVQILNETAQQPAVAPRFSLVLPTGDRRVSFGNDALGFQTNLPVSKIVSDRWTLHGNLGATVLPDVQGHTLVDYNLGGSAIYAVSRDLNLMLESVSYFTEQPNGRGATRRETAVILSPGVRYAWNFKSGTQVVAGLGAPIGLTSDTPDFGVFLYFSVEHFFVRSANR